MLEKLFKLSENGTNVKTELIAGLTTFMTMVYILALNPSILSASGMDAGAILTATAVASAILKYAIRIICWSWIECILCIHNLRFYGI